MIQPGASCYTILANRCSQAELFKTLLEHMPLDEEMVMLLRKLLWQRSGVVYPSLQIGCIRSIRYISYLLLALLLLLTIPFASRSGFNLNPNFAIFVDVNWPKINSTPKYEMSVDSYLAPSLVDKVEFKFGLNYKTTNPACFRMDTKDHLQDIWKTRDYAVTKGGKSKLKIPLDIYLPGICQWKLDSIYLYPNTDASFPLPIFQVDINSKSKSNSFSANKSEWGCFDQSKATYDWLLEPKPKPYGFDYIKAAHDNVEPIMNVPIITMKNITYKLIVKKRPELRKKIIPNYRE